MQIINHLPTNYKDIEDNYSNEFKIDNNGKIALTNPIPTFSATQFNVENNVVSIKPEALQKTSIIVHNITNTEIPAAQNGYFNIYTLPTNLSGSITIDLPRSPSDGDELEIFINDQSTSGEIMNKYNVYFRSGATVAEKQIRIAGDNCSLNPRVAANTKNALVGFKFIQGLNFWIASGNCGLGNR